MTRTGKNNRNFNPQLYLDNTRFTGVFFVHLIFLWYSYFAVFTVLEIFSGEGGSRRAGSVRSGFLRKEDESLAEESENSEGE